MIFRRCAPEPDRFGPAGRPSVSLGAGDPASESGCALRARLEGCRFFAGGAAASVDSSLGAGRFVGNARDPRLDSGATDGVTRVFSDAAGAREGVRESARALTSLARTGVLDRGAGLLARDDRFAVAGLVPGWLVSHVLLLRLSHLPQNVLVTRLIRVNIPFHATTRRQVEQHPLR